MSPLSVLAYAVTIRNEGVFAYLVRHLTLRHGRFDLSRVANGST